MCAGKGGCPGFDTLKNQRIHRRHIVGSGQRDHQYLDDDPHGQASRRSADGTQLPVGERDRHYHFLKRAAEWANRPATTAPLGRYGWQKQSSITRPRPRLGCRAAISSRRKDQLWCATRHRGCTAAGCLLKSEGEPYKPALPPPILPPPILPPPPSLRLRLRRCPRHSHSRRDQPLLES